MDKFLFTAGCVSTMPTHTRPLGYYDWTDLPFYYELATPVQYQRYFLLACAGLHRDQSHVSFRRHIVRRHLHSAANNLAWTRPTIFRVLTNAGITWRYYYQDNSVFLAQWADWNNPQIQSNVRNIQEWYDILASPSADQDLPQVVFIERASATGYDEHPGNNIQKGARAGATDHERRY